MSKCINIAPTKVCFFPNDNSSSVEILHHTIYENGVSIGQAFTTLEDTETTLDLSTYLGGWVIGKCNPFKPYEWVCGIDVPAWYVAYTNDCPVVTFTPATSVNDLYVHAIFETQTWQGFDVFTWAVFTAATGWVLATDTVSVQIAVDAAMISQWFSAWDAIYWYNSTTNEVIIFFSPSADPTLTWWTLELWAGGDMNPRTYTNKCKFWTPTTTEAEWEKYIKVKTVCWETSSTSDWLPVCYDGTQYYVRDVENNWVYTTEYKKWHGWIIFTWLPTGTIVTEWYCTLNNTPWVDSIPPNTTVTFNPFTYGTITILLIGWNADITADGNTVVFPEWWSGTRSADADLDNTITITTDANCTALINYVR